jgi:hypothetical protein
VSLKSLSNIVTSKAGLQLLKFRRHSPVILFAVGTVGFVATVVLATRATMKMHDILDEHEQEVEGAKKIADTLEKYSEGDHKKDLAKIHVSTGLKIARVYGPAIVVGGLSILALTGSHVILTRRYTGAVAAYAGLSKVFDEYRDRVKTRFGDQTDRELRYGTETREIVEEGEYGPEVKTITRVKSGEASGYAKWFDQGNRNFQSDPNYNIMFLRAQEKFLNQKLQAQGWLFLSDVYDALDIQQTQASRVVGWLKDAHVKGTGDGYVDFTAAIMNGETQEARDFFNGYNKAVLLDFNVDGMIMEQLKK